MILDADHIWVKMCIDKYRKNSIETAQKKITFYQSLNDSRFVPAVEFLDDELTELQKDSDYQILMKMIYQGLTSSDARLNEAINTAVLGGEKPWMRNII